MTFNELFTKTGMSQAQFSAQFDIPIRTLQNWIKEDNRVPAYIKPMMEEYILSRVSGASDEAKICFRIYCHKAKESIETIIYEYLTQFVDEMKLCEERDTARLGKKKRAEIWNHYKDVRDFTEKVVTQMMDESAQTLADVLQIAYGAEAAEYQMFLRCEEKLTSE